jgi:hypothetical protein
MEKEKKYVYEATVRKVYGLTPSMIQELGPPDKYCENPHWKSGPLASLYLVERVEAWAAANRGRLEKAEAGRVKRSAAMKAVHEKKRVERRNMEEVRREQYQACLRKAEEWVNGLEITVAQPFPPTLLEDARKAYKFKGHADPLKEKALVAHVRHSLTNYMKLVRQLPAQVFGVHPHNLLRNRVNAVVRRALAEWKEALTGLQGPPDAVRPNGRQGTEGQS